MSRPLHALVGLVGSLVLAHGCGPSAATGGEERSEVEPERAELAPAEPGAAEELGATEGPAEGDGGLPLPPFRWADVTGADAWEEEPEPGWERASACGRCHQEELEQMRGSAHQRAFSNRLFQREVRGQERPECVSCHAPLAWASARRTPDARTPEARTSDDRRPELDRELASEGVSCVVCHLREGRILATEVSGRAPHPSRVEPAFGESSACGSCHEFLRPGGREMLQTTMHEWRRSRAASAGVGCQGCHMREQGGQLSHSFAGSRDPRVLAQSVEAEVSAFDDGFGTTVDLRLLGLAGHSVPTGDIFRRLRLTVWLDGSPRTGQTRVFGERPLRAEEGSEEDDRIPPSGAGPREIHVEIPERGRRVRYRLELLHLAMHRTPDAPLSDGETSALLLEGAVDIVMRSE